MAVNIEKHIRSANMSTIRSKDTKPELKARQILHKLGYRFRLHRKDLFGRPDIVLPKHNAVIFVNGCFWHRHQNCKEASRLKTRSDYWENKLNRNVERDALNYSKLREIHWKVIVLWECELERQESEIILVLKERLSNIC